MVGLKALWYTKDENGYSVSKLVKILDAKWDDAMFEYRYKVLDIEANIEVSSVKSWDLFCMSGL